MKVLAISFLIAASLTLDIIHSFERIAGTRTSVRWSSRNRDLFGLRMDIDYPQSTSTSSFPPPSPSRKMTLDEVQRAAITSSGRAVIVVAGPGSGKTRVMSARLAYLLESGLCRPTEILVISFTKSTANNMRQQADTLLHESESVATTRGVDCHTFHTFCIDVIRRHLVPDLHIINDEDKTRLILSLLESKGLSPSYKMANSIQRQIRYWKELGLGYMGVRKDTLVSEVEKRAYELYPEYQNRLKHHTMDLGDVLLNTLKLFRGDSEILESYRQKYRHVLVDEFQDISPAQYDILRMLVVGQSSSFSATGGSLSMSSNPGDNDVLHPVILQLPDDSSTLLGNNHYYGDFNRRNLENMPSKRMPVTGTSMTGDRIGLKYRESIELPFSNRRNGHHRNSDSNRNTLDSIPLSSSMSRINMARSSKIVNVFCAGDDDQSIYAWRGAQVELMRRFRFDFPGASVLRFDVSYRLSEELCQAANSVVSRLPGRIEKHTRGQAVEEIVPTIIHSGENNGFNEKGNQVSLQDGSDNNDNRLSSNARYANKLQDSDDKRYDNIEEALAESPAAIKVRRMADEKQEIEQIVRDIRQQLKRNTGKAEKTIVVMTKTQADLNRIKEELTSQHVPYRSRGYGA